MGLIKALAEYNIHHIREGIRILDEIDDDRYSARNDELQLSAVGEHLRHIVEHYQCFLDGFEAGVVDYDARKRDLRISNSRAFARDTMTALIDAIACLDGEDISIEVCMSAGSSGDESSQRSRSTICRELQYLQAHTIHHYALISVLLRVHGLELDAEFGVAPSTLKHRLSG